MDENRILQHGLQYALPGSEILFVFHNWMRHWVDGKQICNPYLCVIDQYVERISVKV